MQPFFESQPIRFSCTGCGRCCETADDYFVFLTRQKAERICEYLALTPAWFKWRYLSRLKDGDLVLASSGSERCVFPGLDARCRIYPVRPMQCSTYPFWPEVVMRRRSWQQEAKRCEGINRGPPVRRTVIRRAISRCQAETD